MWDFLLKQLYLILLSSVFLHVKALKSFNLKANSPPGQSGSTTLATLENIGEVFEKKNTTNNSLHLTFMITTCY